MKGSGGSALSARALISSQRSPARPRRLPPCGRLRRDPPSPPPPSWLSRGGGGGRRPVIAAGRAREGIRRVPRLLRGRRLCPAAHRVPSERSSSHRGSAALSFPLMERGPSAPAFNLTERGAGGSEP